MFPLLVSLLDAFMMAGLAVIVLLKKQRTEVHTAFILTCASASVWMLASGLMVSPIDFTPLSMRLTASVMFFSGLAGSTGFLWMAWEIPRGGARLGAGRLWWLVGPLLLTLLLLIAGRGLIREVCPEKPVPDRLAFFLPGFIVYGSALIGNIVWAMAALARKKARLAEGERPHLLYIVIGSLITLSLGGIIMVLLPLLGFTRLVILAPLMGIPMLVITAQAVTEL